jgi:GTP-binding protein LepA
LSAHIGDTICHADKLVDALPGFKPMKAMVRASPSHDHTQLIVQVYAGVFPVDSGDFSKLEEAIERVSFGSSMTLL